MRDLCRVCLIGTLIGGGGLQPPQRPCLLIRSHRALGFQPVTVGRTRTFSPWQMGNDYRLDTDESEVAKGLSVETVCAGVVFGCWPHEGGSRSRGGRRCCSGIMLNEKLSLKS